MIIKSENADEDKQASIKITKIMTDGSCKRIIWYSALGKDMAELKDQNGFLAAEIRRLSEKIAACSSELSLIKEEKEKMVKQ